MDAITNFMSNGGIIIALGLLILAVGLSVIFSIVGLLSNFEESKKALLGVVGLAVLVIIGFALAGGELPQFAIDRGINAKQYKLIGGIINTAVIATVGMVVFLVVDAILGLIRN